MKYRHQLEALGWLLLAVTGILGLAPVNTTVLGTTVRCGSTFLSSNQDPACGALSDRQTWVIIAGVAAFIALTAAFYPRRRAPRPIPPTSSWTPPPGWIPPAQQPTWPPQPPRPPQQQPPPPGWRAP